MSDTKEIKLAPCPFCGFEVHKHNVRSKKSKRSGGVEWTCRCPICITYGPRAGTEEEAIKAWNTRLMNNEETE